MARIDFAWLCDKAVWTFRGGAGDYVRSWRAKPEGCDRRVSSLRIRMQGAAGEKRRHAWPCTPIEPLRSGMSAASLGRRGESPGSSEKGDSPLTAKRGAGNT
jgi:hypothetical protein